MAKPRPCGCKGVRTCLICEHKYGAQKRDFSIDKTEGNGFVYCPYCDKAWPGWDINDYKQHPNHAGEPINYPGVLIQLDFLSVEEEEQLMRGLNQLPWDVSQSGRRKQNFGPKCNFKKKKLSLGNFNGFPKFTKYVQDRLACVPLLRGFQTIEQCSLEYCPERGSSIDPHVDDCWIWGERVVTVNVTGDSVLTMTSLSEKDRCRYNLDLAPSHLREFPPTAPAHVVRLPMPARSLIVLFGQARYQWEHSVLREDVNNHRVCLAYREFTPPYLEGGQKYDDLVLKVLDKSTIFWEHLC